ncbi:MAG: SPOR domain-containing protein [Gammaproteobacteria bacterium]|nr:SPOR domain-containing protein [Gammaproteobacteria bacterium]
MSSPTQQPATVPDYLSILGLDRAPFLDQIDDHFFYADPALIQHLDLLQHLTRFGDMLLGINGPLGSGKTSLLRQFLLRGNTTWRSCLIDGGKISRPDELLARLAECFGQDMNAAPERIKADVIRYCQALQHNSQQALVVIEDAHLLSEPALKTLLELGGDVRETLKLVRVLLFSEADIKQKLVDMGLHSPQQPLLHSLDVPRFDERQTAAYLMYRLAAAGFSGDSPFSLTEIRAMHKAADGLPGKLNSLAHETLIEHANRLVARKKLKPAPKPVSAEAASKPRTRSRAMLILAGVILSLGAAGGYLMQSGQLHDWLDKLDRPANDQQLAVTPIPEPASTETLELTEAPETPADPADTEQPPDSRVVAEETGIVEATPKNKQEIDIKEDIALETESIGPVSTEASAEPATPAPAITPESTPVTPEDKPATQNLESVPETLPAPSETTADEDAIDTSIVPEKTALTAEPAEQATPSPASEPKPAESTKENVPSADDTAVATAPAKATGRPENLDLMDTAWLLERPASHFTLQLLGVRNESSLQQFLAKSKLPGPVAYFHTEYKGGDWYVLVQGDYPTMAAAQAAINTLPSAVRKSKPWPRTFATVQADIQKAAP